MTSRVEKQNFDRPRTFGETQSDHISIERGGTVYHYDSNGKKLDGRKFGGVKNKISHNQKNQWDLLLKDTADAMKKTGTGLKTVSKIGAIVQPELTPELFLLYSAGEGLHKSGRVVKRSGKMYSKYQNDGSISQKDLVKMQNNIEKTIVAVSPLFANQNPEIFQLEEEIREVD